MRIFPSRKESKESTLKVPAAERAHSGRGIKKARRVSDMGQGDIPLNDHC